MSPRAVGLEGRSIVETRPAASALDLRAVFLLYGLAFAGTRAGLGGDSRPSRCESSRDDLRESFAGCLQVTGSAARAARVEYQIPTARQAVVESREQERALPIRQRFALLDVPAQCYASARFVDVLPARTTRSARRRAQFARWDDEAPANAQVIHFNAARSRGGKGSGS